MSEPLRASVVDYRWRSSIEPGRIDAFVSAAFGERREGWWERVSPQSLGWATAHDGDHVVGFLNVVSDGAMHAFVLDTAVDAGQLRRGIGTELVRIAVEEARRAGCQWIHVDFEAALARFYLDSCGFKPTAAGLIELRREG